MRSGRVVVAGGGLAGIAAALACADGGASVTLLEARPRLGGATWSARRDGLTVDNGQHVFLRCCTAYRDLLRRLGSEDATELQPRLSLPVLAPGGATAWLRRQALPAPLHLAWSLLRFRHLSLHDRLSLPLTALKLGRLDLGDRGLDGCTFGDWLAERGQSPAAIDRFWNLIALPTLNLGAAEASLALAAKVFQTGLLSEASAADVGYARVPLDEVHGEPAAKALAAAGVDVRLRARVAPPAVQDGAVTGIDAGGAHVEADAVILAVPHGDAAALLPAGALPEGIDLRELGESPIVNLHVVYDRKVTDHAVAAGVGTPVQWVFDRTAAAGVTHGQYLAVSLSGADEYLAQKSEDLGRIFLPALASLFPRARDAQVERFFGTREPAATFRQAPGTWRLRPGPETMVRGLFLAGAWTDTGWPATMEGAVRSGLQAARRALIATGRTARLPAEVVA